jgi:N-acetylmuramoyl-L-alanine amidase CwlA
MVNINELILPVTPNCRTGIKRPTKWIVIHETGNTSHGANANAHAKYLANIAKEGKQYVSWHYTVDDKEIIHHIPDDEIAWHAGDWAKDKVNGGNACGIGIELCVNGDGDFNKTIKLGSKLVANLLKKYSFPNVGSVVRQHWEFSGKNCPQTLRETKRWQEFLNLCQAELDVLNTPAPVVIPATPPAPAPNDAKIAELNVLIDGLRSSVNSLTAINQNMTVRIPELVSEKDKQAEKATYFEKENARLVARLQEIKQAKDTLAGI